MITKAWGNFNKIPDENLGIKYITILSNKTLKLKKNTDYYRYCFVFSGTATLYSLDSSSDVELHGTYKEREYFWVDKNTWYQISNETDSELVILEIKYI